MSELSKYNRYRALHDGESFVLETEDGWDCVMFMRTSKHYNVKLMHKYSVVVALSFPLDATIPQMMKKLADVVDVVSEA